MNGQSRELSDQGKGREAVSLPVIPVAPVLNCDGCGVCCTEVALPPFLDDIDFLPPDLLPEIMQALAMEAELVAAGKPCIWFDVQTRKCRHHEHRPNICREYEIGGELCLECRERYGVR